MKCYRITFEGKEYYVESDKKKTLEDFLHYKGVYGAEIETSRKPHNRAKLSDHFGILDFNLLQAADASQIVQKMGETSFVTDQISRFFRTKSKFYKRMEEYIRKADVDKCAIIDKTGDLKYSRGVGAIHFESAHLLTSDHNSLTHDIIRLWLKVDMYTPDGDWRSHTEIIDAPLDLVVNFTEKKFKAWVNKEKRGMKKRASDRATKELEELVERHPELAKKLKPKKVAK